MLALAFSLLFTGLGQIYNGQYAKGLLFVLIQIVNFALIYWFIGLITAPAFWLYGMIDAVDVAVKLTTQAEQAEGHARV